MCPGCGSGWILWHRDLRIVFTPAPSGWQKGMFDTFWEEACAGHTCWKCPSLLSGWFSPLGLYPLFLSASLPTVGKQNKQRGDQVSNSKWSFLKNYALERSASSKLICDQIISKTHLVTLEIFPSWHPRPVDLPGWPMVAPCPQRIKAPRSNM